jgi:hypothetical protein
MSQDKKKDDGIPGARCKFQWHAVNLLVNLPCRARMFQSFILCFESSSCFGQHTWILDWVTRFGTTLHGQARTGTRPSCAGTPYCHVSPHVRTLFAWGSGGCPLRGGAPEYSPSGCVCLGIRAPRPNPKAGGHLLWKGEGERGTHLPLHLRCIHPLSRLRYQHLLLPPVVACSLVISYPPRHPVFVDFSR